MMQIFYSIGRICNQGLWLVLWLSVSGILNAVSSAKDSVEKVAVAHVSLVALGSVPARRYGEDEDRERPESRSKKKQGTGTALLPPLEGTVPPSILYYKVAQTDSKHKNDEWNPIRVGYNRAAPSVKVPAGQSLATYMRNRGQRSGYKPYLKIPRLQPGAQMLCFLFNREGGKMSWQFEPKISMLNLNSQALCDKNLLIRNFSDESITYIMGDKKPAILASGQRKSFKLDKSIAYHRVAAIEGQQLRFIMNTSVRVPDEAFTVFAFYNRNPQTNSGKSVGVCRATLRRYPVEVSQAGEKIEK